MRSRRALESGDPRVRDERAAVVRANALRAIQMDPAVPMSYTALAAVQAYHEWDFPAAEATLRQGLAAFPQNGAARNRLALLTGCGGAAGGGDRRSRSGPQSGAASA